MRPADLPYAETYQQMPCGTRAKYVAVHCRCAKCRAANSRYVQQRDALAKAEARARQSQPHALVPFGAPQTWTRPDGTKAVRLYKRACHGIDGPCPFRSHLRKDSTGDLCMRCRSRLVWNGLVAADAVRRHLKRLSRQGVGYKSVAAAADVSRTALAEIIAGKKHQLRAQSAKRILAVDRDAVGDRALVPAWRTWSRINRLLKEGFTKAELARRLGRKRAALQICRSRVTARTAANVERLYHIVMVV